MKTPGIVYPEARISFYQKMTNYIRRFNEGFDSNHKYFVHLDRIATEAFTGDREAPIVLLSNNPGFGRGAPDKEKPNFVAIIRKNLLHEPSDFPFPFLDPSFSGPSKQWWERKLKHILARFGYEVVARSILNVVHFPYPSQRYGHGRLRLPSQDYNFRLVREAVNRKAVIVRMRNNRNWFTAVPELIGYDHLYQVENWQNPAISPRNCRGFEQVVQAIQAAEEKRQG